MSQAAVAQRAPSMGPLTEYLFEGRDGVWQASFRDGGFVLSNESDPGAIFYLYANAGVAGNRTIRVEVKADWGESSRIGLLYGFQPQGSLYYPLVIEDGGRQISLLRRGESGIEARSSNASNDRWGREGWRELVIVERGSEIEWSIDGQTLGGLGNSELGRGGVGIIAMGTGSFAFRGFEVSGSAAKSSRSMPPAQPGADEASQNAVVPPATTIPAPDSRSVQIMDQAFNMPMWREKVPAGWQVFQRIATDMNRGSYTAFLRDIYGPRGELIRDLGQTTHNSAVGLSSNLIIPKLIATTVQQPTIGQGRTSEMMESLWVVKRKRLAEEQQGRSLQTYEIPFEGMREGKPVKGMFYLMNTPFPQFRDAGFMEFALVVSSPEHFAQALQVNEGVLRSRELSGDYEKRKHQHNQLATQRNQIDHQKRMEQLKVNYEAHQTRMRGVYASSDALHQSWMNSNRRGSTSSGGEYGGQDAFVDQIHERTTINDPYSGQEIHQDGQRDRWFTNGLGDFVGTDDPSFNPYALQGNWQAIEPSRPGGR
ncbi:MAG: hypothetical protein GY703_16310 [Gammaproteobacteria bacterium]|nr:hypothetical protein [Gammaproteobacteria bacterium]